MSKWKHNHKKIGKLKIIFSKERLGAFFRKNDFLFGIKGV